MKKDQLIKAAESARKFAQAPYSKFRVGAALLGASGKVYSGCNVESSSFSLTICAERVALVKALSEGETEFEAIAVVTEKGATPCGACRQLLWDYAGDIPVHAADSNGSAKDFKLSELLVHPFEDSQFMQREEE